MVDVVFRYVDEATLRRLLEILGDTSYAIEGEEPEWTPEMAERVLRIATPRAVVLARALVDHGGQVDIDTAQLHPGRRWCRSTRLRSPGGCARGRPRIGRSCRRRRGTARTPAT